MRMQGGSHRRAGIGEGAGHQSSQHPLAALMRGLCVGAALPAPPGMSAQVSLFSRDTLGTNHSRELPLLCAERTDTPGRTELLLCWLINAQGSVSGACFHLLTAPSCPACQGGWNWLLLTGSIQTGALAVSSLT